MVQIVFECNGSDVVSLPYEQVRTQGDLLRIAQDLAAEKDVDLSEITLRFTADNHLAASAMASNTRPATTR